MKAARRGLRCWAIPPERGGCSVRNNLPRTFPGTNTFSARIAHDETCSVRNTHKAEAHGNSACTHHDACRGKASCWARRF